MVIAVIGILASMIMPSISKAKKTAQSAVCLNNLKSMGVANYLYAGANDGYLVPYRVKGAQVFWFRNPQFIESMDAKPRNGGWHWDSSYLCPSSPAAKPSDARNQLFPSSYSLNSNKPLGGGRGGEYAQGILLSSSKNTNAVMISDGRSRYVDQWRSFFDKWITEGDESRDANVAYRHKSRANYVALDGSAHHGNRTWLDRNAEAWQSGWQRD